MLRRCKEIHGKQKILKNADSNQRNRLGIQKLRSKRSKMSINETGCATHSVMRQVSKIRTWCTKRQAILGCATHPPMRHASKWNQRLWTHYTTKNTMMRHASTDAARIESSEFQTIKQTEGSFSVSLSPFFIPHPSFRLRPEVWFHHFSHFERDPSCSTSFFFIGIDFYT